MKASPGMCQGCTEVIHNEDSRMGLGCRIKGEFLNVGFDCPKQNYEEKRTTRIWMDEEVSIQNEDCSLFTIFMRTDDENPDGEGEQCIELDTNEIDSLIPYMKEWSKRVKKEFEEDQR